MVNNEQIKECFAGLVGFKQPYDPVYPRLSEDLTQSISGWFIDKIHPLCSIENLVNIAPNFANFNYSFPTWTAKEYEKSDKVAYSNQNYVAKTDIHGSHINENPAISSHWKIYDPFSEWLSDILSNSSVNFINELLRNKRYWKVSRSFVDSMNLYQGFGSLQNRIVKDGRFVGVEIFPNKQEGLIIKFDQIGIQVDTVQSNFKLYLYHSSQIDPIKEIEIDLTEAGSFGWYDVEDLILDSNSSDVDSNGVYYLGYYEDDLTGQAIYREMDFMKPCRTCSSYDINSFNAWSKYLKINAFTVDNEYLDEGKKLFDQDLKRSRSDQNFGLNFKISIYCDLTRLICRNKMPIAEAYAQHVALNLIEQIAFNTRLGGISDKTKQLAMLELDPKENSGSFYSRYQKSMSALNLDFSGTSSVCLPCGDDNLKIKRKAI